LVPTTVELAQAYSVSIATSHRAIALLHGEGLIEVSRGRRATVRADAVAPASDGEGIGSQDDPILDASVSQGSPAAERRNPSP